MKDIHTFAVQRGLYAEAGLVPAAAAGMEVEGTHGDSISRVEQVKNNWKVAALAEENRVEDGGVRIDTTAENAELVL